MGATAQVDLEHLAADAQGAINAFRDAAERHADALEALSRLQARRPARKMAALVRLCQTEHPANGKVMSVTQADDMLALDEEYAAYKSDVAVAELQARRTEDAKDTAWLQGQLAIARYKVEAGLT